MEDRVVKLEKQIAFLRRELESQNLAITRVERTLEGGSLPEKKTMSTTDIEMAILGFETQLKKHQEILKQNTITLVGLNDLLEQIRDFFRSSVSDIKLDQKDHMQSYQKMLSGAVESLRAEFLLVLRDFRQKYPKLEKFSLEKDVDVKTSLSKLEKNDIWTDEQKVHLEIKIEEMEQMIERYIQDSFGSVVDLFSIILNKTEELSLIIKEKKI
jgi:hypothetical protein